MYKTFLLLLVLFFLLVSHSFAESTTDFVLTGTLKSRKIVGCIHFNKNNIDLSAAQMAEIDRIVAKSVSHLESSKIVRIEGFSSLRTTSVPVDVAFSRARSVWQYLVKRDAVDLNKLYLTGFTDEKSLKSQNFDRVEIAIYDDPFAEKMDIYSKIE